MSQFIRSDFLQKWVRSFTARFGVTVLMLASAPWSTAFAWDPAIELMLTTVDPSYRVSSQFTGLSDEEKLVWAQKERLGGWSLVNLGVTAGEKVNLFARTRGQTGIGSVRLELTGSQTVSRTDNTAPFTLFEDIVGTALPAGTYQFSVTAYPEADLGGTPGTTNTRSFTLVSDSTPPTVSVVCGTEPTASDSQVAVNIEISEPVLGFGFDDIEFTNIRRHVDTIEVEGETLEVPRIQVMGGTRDANGRWNWSVDVEPDTAGAETTVLVPAGVVSDEVGNQNTASGLLHIARNRTVSVADASAMEGAGATIDFEVTLDTRNDCETVTVDWATADDTATAGEDYTAASGTLTFGPGETNKTVSIVILDDAVTEGEETFILQMSNASGAALAGTTTGTITRSAKATPRGSSGNSASATAIGTITNDDTAAVDTDPPSVTVTSDAQEPVRGGENGYINSNRFDVTVTFSEPVSDFDLSDLEVTNSSAESISPSSDGTQYTVTIDPIHTGEVTVKVPAGVATDAADNPNTASATFDIWAFGLSNSGAPSVTLRCGQRFTPTSFNVNLGFNRPIWGFDSDDVEITGATGFSALRLSGADATGRGLLWGSFGAAFDPSPGPGQMTVQVPAGAVRDRAGTSGQVVTSTASNTLRVALNRNASVADASATEGTDATMDFEVTLDTIDDCVTVTVEWTTEDGTATAGEDYSAASGTLTFGPGETAKTVSVVILDDSLVDNGETITLRLSNSSGASIADAEATGTITDDEATVDGNTAPTGLPEISGTAHVGETLTASASGIADADGLTNGAYAWQWIANDGASDADIADATGNHPPKTAGYFGLSSGGGGAPGWGAWRRSRLMQPDRAAGRLASSTEGVRRAGSAASRRSCREHRRARPADRHC